MVDMKLFDALSGDTGVYADELKVLIRRATWVTSQSSRTFVCSSGLAKDYVHDGKCCAGTY